MLIGNKAVPRVRLAISNNPVLNSLFFIIIPLFFLFVVTIIKEKHY